MTMSDSSPLPAKPLKIHSNTPIRDQRTGDCRGSCSAHKIFGAPPPQTVSDDVDYLADHTPVIDTWSAMGAQELRFDALELGFGQPIVIRHEQVLLPLESYPKLDLNP